MEPSRIASLLQPFVRDTPSAAQLAQISTYIDILLRWNARVNLTAVRDPEQIVTRHFGESLFTAEQLFPGSNLSPTSRVVDIGSGAGFPGVPLKLRFPSLEVTLVESKQKKVAFIREVIRQLTLININVFPGRAEEYSGLPADVVTLRAVEKFESIMPIAASKVTPRGRLALLIGANQERHARELGENFSWGDPARIPLSETRVLLVGVKNPRSDESKT